MHRALSLEICKGIGISQVHFYGKVRTSEYSLDPLQPAKSVDGDGEGGGGDYDLVEAFLLPLVSILSLMLLVLVVLCQRQCILDLASSSSSSSGARGGGRDPALVVETVSGENLR